MKNVPSASPAANTACQAQSAGRAQRMGRGSRWDQLAGREHRHRDGCWRDQADGKVVEGVMLIVRPAKPLTPALHSTAEYRR